MRHVVPLLVGAAAFAAVAPASAQTIAVKAGLTRSTIVFADDVLEVEPRAGLLVGGEIGVPLAGRLRLQSGALFVERRVRFEGVVEDRLRYVEIPVLARYRVLEARGLRLHAEGGGSLAVLLAAAEKISGVSADISDTMESTEFALIAGAAVDWRSRWTFGVRYLHGVSDIYAVPEFPARHRALQVTAAFRIR